MARLGACRICVMGRWKQAFPMLTLFLGLSCVLSTSVVESVGTAASEWPLGLPDEYTMAVISIKIRGKNGTDARERPTQSGRFGKGGRIIPVRGVVVHVRSRRNGTLNHYACEPIISEVPQNEPWIALIKRGMCDFDVKLQHAAAKNAAAMVVYDREESDTLEDMKLTTYNIPGIFTFKSKGEHIANMTDRGMRVEMSIELGEVCSRPYTGINRTYNGRFYLSGDSGIDGVECYDRNTSVLFVSISFIVLMIISLAWLVFYYIQRFRYLHAKDRLAQRLCNAAKKALAKIPTRSVKLTDKEVIGEAECCAVCIDFYKAGDMLRTLPCRHEFHKLCVDPWLLEHRTCPMCKMDILKHYGYIFTGSQESILHLDEDATLNSSSESREDSETTSEESQIQTHHQHHRIHHHPTDSLSISSPTENETLSSIPEDEDLAEIQIEDEVSRKPSLISLTVTTSPNRTTTTTRATPSAMYPPTNPSCLVPSATPTTTAVLKASIASSKDTSKVITSLVSEEQASHCPIIMASSGQSLPTSDSSMKTASVQGVSRSQSGASSIGPCKSRKGSASEPQDGDQVEKQQKN